MSKSFFPEGVQRWPIEKWQNCHENFVHRFQKNTSFKLVLPDSLPSSTDKYRATTANFMWLIQYALDNNIHLRAMGNGWSFSEVAVCEGGGVDTKALRLSFALKDSFVHASYLQSGKKSADLFLVQCGMSMLQVHEKLEAGKRSLKASGASNGQSIAGATATGTHGAAYKTGAVHDSIVGLHIITGADRHVWLEKKSKPVASDEFIDWLKAEKISDDDIFNSAVISFGSFGFVHGVLLETDPIFLLEEHKSGELTYDPAFVQAMTTLDFSSIADKMPYPANTPGKELYHVELLANPHDFEPGNPEKGVFLRTLYKTAYTPDYVKREREVKGYQYGDSTLGLIQTILDTLGSKSALLVPKLVNLLLPLVFKPSPVALGTMGETFSSTRFRGKAASAAIAMNASDSSRVLEEIVALNKETPFPGVAAFRYVKGTEAILGFTKFPTTCVLELDGVDSSYSRKFLEKVWNRLETLNIPYTLHWGKLNFILTAQRIRNMYGDSKVNTWKSCRASLLDEKTRKVFNNRFIENLGLAD